jgi:L,D-transpeptidase ErfK/SrfK
MKKKPFLFVAVLLLAVAVPSVATAMAAELSHAIVMKHLEYVVKKGDFLTSIAGHYAESASDLAKDNGLKYNARLVPGQRLVVNSVHVIPETMDDGIIINLPQRMLFFFRNGKLAGAYPVGLGRPTWQTPTGRFDVIALRKDPTWTVPVSIQEEMIREGEVVRTKVPPGPDNPLGKYWIGLSLGGYGVHGTIAPSSIYQFRSHGCIRLHPDDIEELFPLVREKEVGRIIYQRVMLAVLDDGRIFLEVNPDAYRKGGDALPILKTLAKENQLTARIDWQKAMHVIEKKEGIARQINLEPS